MATLGATADSLEPGRVTLSMPFSDRFTQQHGFLHAGTIATLLDSACGYAAFTLMPAGSGVLTIEYKINLLAPARGERLVAAGVVVRPGRTVTVASGSAHSVIGDVTTHVAEMQATVMTITGRNDVVG